MVGWLVFLSEVDDTLQTPHSYYQLTVCNIRLFSPANLSLHFSVCLSVCLSVRLSLSLSQPGDEFYVDDCQLKCRCDAPFVTCQSSVCPPQQECKLQGGELGCYPTSKTQSVLWGSQVAL